MLAVEAAAISASCVDDARAVEEVGVLVGVGDAATNRRPSATNGSAWPSKPLQCLQRSD